MARYHAPTPMPEAIVVAEDTLESIAREGARAMLERMLAEEVDAFLGRARYARRDGTGGYRNGYARKREVGVGTWSVPVRQPRVSDLPEGAAPFESSILPKRRYLSQDTQRLFARLYLKALAAGLSHKEVAIRLELSARTVDGHVQRMYERYGVDGRGSLLMLALRMGWVGPPAAQLTDRRPPRRRVGSSGGCG